MTSTYDKRSGMTFCIGNKDPRRDEILKNGCSDYPMVQWCEQFFNGNNDTFIEIGSDIGTYCLPLSKKCVKVYSYESDKEKYEWLNMAALLNNRFNIVFNESDMPSDELKVSDVRLIRITTQNTSKILKCLKDIIIRNAPKILFCNKDHETTHFFNSIGYNIINVLNSNGQFLAEKSVQQLQVAEEQPSVSLIKLTEKLIKQKKYIAADIALEEAVKFSDETTLKLIEKQRNLLSLFLDNQNDSINSCEAFIFSKLTDWNGKNEAINAITKHIKRLPVIKSVNIPAYSDDGYVTSSFSIIHADDKNLKIILRTVNYFIGEQGSYHVIGGDDNVNTKNYVLELDDNFTVINQVELVNNTNVKIYNNSPVRGIEDVRCASDGWFFGCCRDTNMLFNCQMCVGYYNGNGEIYKFIPLSDESKIEKNWLPFIKDRKKCFVYGWNPFKIMTFSEETFELSEVFTKYFSTVDLSTCRGSTSPIPYKDGYLCLVHNVHYNNPRKYIHRFAFFSLDFEQLKLSHPFYIVEPGVEYSLSLLLHQDKLLMSYSFRDSCSKCLIIDTNVVDNYLSSGINVV